MPSPAIFQPDFRTDPYWWDAAPRRFEPLRPVPSTTDVAVVGSGFTGLSAALTLSRAGRDVTILEEGTIGQGASSRNFGMLGCQLKLDFTTLIKTRGLERAKELYGACNQAFSFVNRLIEREGIECFHAPSGRYIACNTPALLDALQAELEARETHLGHKHRMVSHVDQPRELVTKAFVGGAVIPEHRTVHPGLFHNGLADRVRAAGAALHSSARVRAIVRDGNSWRIETDSGLLKASHLVAATNGYTEGAFPWLRRRIVPIHAYMIATEPLDEELLRNVLPTARGFHDSAHDMQYARVAPDGSRLIYGAMTGERHTDLRNVARALHARMTRLFPQLAAVRLSHVWTGQCGGTFDFVPHRGDRQGMQYAMGYCFGAGMPFGSWLGDAIARGILGEEFRDAARRRNAVPSALLGQALVPADLPPLPAMVGLEKRSTRMTAIPTRTSRGNETATTIKRRTTCA